MVRLRLRLTNRLGNQRINRLFNRSDYTSLAKIFQLQELTKSEILDVKEGYYNVKMIH